jgi:hypothetical protein
MVYLALILLFGLQHSIMARRFVRLWRKSVKPPAFLLLAALSCV